MKRNVPELSAEYEVQLQLLAPTAKQKAAGVKHLLRCYFHTLREFSSFRYNLKVEMSRTEDAVAFRIGGISVPPLQLPAEGTAGAEHFVTLNKDSLTMHIQRKEQGQSYIIRIEKKTVIIEPLGEESLIRVVSVS